MCKKTSELIKLLFYFKKLIQPINCHGPWKDSMYEAYSDRLDPNYFYVYVFGAAFFSFFFGSAAIVDFVNCEQSIRALFTVPQITLFSNFFIKNGSHNTIYTFKNYFATVFSVSVFSFCKNKLNPNTPIILSLLSS